jgi:hypothetical protein
LVRSTSHSLSLYTGEFARFFFLLKLPPNAPFCSRSRARSLARSPSIFAEESRSRSRSRSRFRSRSLSRSLSILAEEFRTRLDELVRTANAYADEC